MDYIKKVENQLNNLEAAKRSLEILPLTIKETKLEVYILNKALDNMTEQERNVIQKICIENKTPYELEKEFKMTARVIYKLKNKVLKKMATMVYGIEV